MEIEGKASIVALPFCTTTSDSEFPHLEILVDVVDCQT
jgi:hypothetical protein